MVCLMTCAKKARKVTGLPNKRLKKIKLFSNDHLVLIRWDTSGMRKCSGINNTYCLCTIYSYWLLRMKGKSGLWNPIPNGRTSGNSMCFTGISIGQFRLCLCLRISVSRLYLGQILSFAEWPPPQLGHFGAAALHSLYLCSPPQIEQRSLPRQWPATCP